MQAIDEDDVIRADLHGGLIELSPAGLEVIVGDPHLLAGDQRLEVLIDQGQIERLRRLIVIIVRKRGELDGTPAVIEFADALEAAALQTVEAGIMTGDLLLLAEKKPSNRKVNTEGFIDAIADKLKGKI